MGVVICVLSKSKLADFIASLFLIAAYGFAAPTAPTVMSVFFIYSSILFNRLKVHQVHKV